LIWTISISIQLQVVEYYQPPLKIPLLTRTKWKIVFLAIHRYGLKMTLGEISKEQKCAINIVKYWMETFKDTGDVKEVPRTRRLRKTTKNQDDTILKLVV
jgi:hypothetical protein